MRYPVFNAIVKKICKYCHSPTVEPAGFVSPFFISSPLGNDTTNRSGNLRNEKL